MPLGIYSCPQHAALAVDACIDQQKIVISGKTMLVDQMATSLLPIAAHFLAAFDKAGESLLTAFSLGGNDRIVIFRDVQLEEVSRGKVGFAVRAAVTVHLVVVSLIFEVG